MDYQALSPMVINQFYKAYEYIHASGLDSRLMALVELRISQINGCCYCCSLHTEEARDKKVTQETLDKLPGWVFCSNFSEREKLALQWAEILTFIDSNKHNVHPHREVLLRYFTEKEVVDLTACIALMHGFNRIAIALQNC